MTHDEHAHPPGEDPPPTAYAKRGTLTLQGIGSEAALLAAVDAFLSELTRSLINDNVFSWTLIQKFMDEANHLTKLLKSGSDVVDPFLERLKDSMGGKLALESAREFRNQVLESLKKE